MSKPLGDAVLVQACQNAEVRSLYDLAKMRLEVTGLTREEAGGRLAELVAGALQASSDG